MNRLISRTSWMRDILDTTTMTELSIPGTHNSVCIGGLFGLAQTRNVDLPAQLEAGIRFLDIRLALCNRNLHVHHDMKCMDSDYEDVLYACTRFLRQYPSETILMSIKDEIDLRFGAGKFAPSRILGKLTKIDISKRKRGESSFEDALRASTCEHATKSPLRFPALLT